MLFRSRRTAGAGLVALGIPQVVHKPVWRAFPPRLPLRGPWVQKSRRSPADSPLLHHLLSGRSPELHRLSLNQPPIHSGGLRRSASWYSAPSSSELRLEKPAAAREMISAVVLGLDGCFSGGVWYEAVFLRSLLACSPLVQSACLRHRSVLMCAARASLIVPCHRVWAQRRLDQIFIFALPN